MARKHRRIRRQVKKFLVSYTYVNENGYRMIVSNTYTISGKNTSPDYLFIRKDLEKKYNTDVVITSFSEIALRSIK